MIPFVDDQIDSDQYACLCDLEIPHKCLHSCNSYVAWFTMSQWHFIHQQVLSLSRHPIIFFSVRFTSQHQYLYPSHILSAIGIGSVKKTCVNTDTDRIPYPIRPTDWYDRVWKQFNGQTYSLHGFIVNAPGVFSKKSQIMMSLAREICSCHWTAYMENSTS